MAGRRVYGSGGGASPDGGEAGGSSNFFTLHASSSSSPFFGSRSFVSFEDTSNHNSLIDDELEDYLCHQNPEKKRRLSVEQVQFLERCFDEENKLGPERKIHLAKDLGLQPRQVAIWFQNRRARWKNKQLEKDYLALKARYDTLKANYDTLLNEKDKLNTQITILSDKLFHNKMDKRSNCSESLKPLLLPQILSTESVSEGEVSKPSAKEEDVILSSSNTAGTKSWYAFELSDLSREEKEGSGKTIFPPYDNVSPKLDDAGCFSDHQSRPPADGLCGLEFYMEDHAFWSWSY